MSIIPIVTTFVADHWDDITAVGGLVLGWLWHKKKGEKTKTVREMLDDVVRQVINAADVDPGTIKARAERELRAVLVKVGVTGKAAELLVHEFVEYAAAEFAERWSAMAKAFEELKAANAKLAAGLT